MKLFTNSFINTLFLGAILISCSGNEDNSNSTNSPSSAEADSLEVASDSAIIDSIDISDDYAYLFEKANGTQSIPFKIDSVYITDQALGMEESLLDGKDVRFLTSNLLDHELTIGVKYDINSFLEIDSLKTNNAYDDYLSSLDIGMMAKSDAFVMEIIEINETEKILLWYITYSTYEACPYASGTIVFGSYFVDGNFGNTALLGEESGGGDPPYWGGTLVESEISETGIWLERINRSGGDEDEEGNEIIEFSSEIYDLEFFQGKIVQSGV